MSDTTQTFKLTSPTGEVIMTGPMNAIMERLPDTHARNDAIDSMLRTACDAVAAEERKQDAVRSCAQMLCSFADQMNARIDAYEAECEAKAKAAAEEAEREEQEQIKATLDALPDPDDPDPLTPGDTTTDDDGELTVKHANEREDAGPDPIPLRATSAPGATRSGPDPGTIEYPPHPQVASPTAISLNSDGA